MWVMLFGFPTVLSKQNLITLRFPKDHSTIRDKCKHLIKISLSFDPTTFEWQSVRRYNLVYRPLLLTNPTAGTILKHAFGQTMATLDLVGGPRLAIFKVGVTANPMLRYPSYLELGYTNMRVVHVTESVHEVHMLEAALIFAFKEFRGCKNVGWTGGEGALHRTKPFVPPFFAYVVAGRADLGRWVGWEEILGNFEIAGLLQWAGWKEIAVVLDRFCKADFESRNQKASADLAKQHQNN